AFDLYILKRPGAEFSYSEQVQQKASDYFHTLSEEDKQKLTNTIIAGLPGAEEGYSLLAFQEILDTYKDIDEKALANNLRLFLDTILPVAEGSGVSRAIHPDDPPYPIFGLTRVVSTASDYKRIISDNNSPNNGFAFCTGSLGVRADNN